jgi:hypothetical protein
MANGTVLITDAGKTASIASGGSNVTHVATGD